MLDTIVLGAGPAGLSAALWLEDLGLRYQVIEQGEGIGGELPRINMPVGNYLGISDATGGELLDLVRRQAGHAALEIAVGQRVVRISARQHAIELDTGERRARTLVLATGQRRRRLGLPAAEARVGRGVTYSATTDLDRIKGHAVALVGGGDGAVDNALILADHCPEVHVLARSDRLRARRDLLARAEQNARVHIHLQATVSAVEAAGDRLGRVHLSTPHGETSLSVAWLVIKIGFVPNTDLLVGGAVTLDETGHIVVDRYMRTSCPGVFAAGDVCNPRSPCLAAAVGDGALAAREAARFVGRYGAGPADPRGA